MRLADLMGARVIDGTGRDIGHVSDVRLTESAGTVHPGMLHLDGIVIATRRRSRLLGYDHRPVAAPWPLTALARRAARHALWAPWTAVTTIRPPSRLGEPGTLTLDRESSVLTELTTMHGHWNTTA
ncbi:PRC-barrel domain-containing protein [Streptomyces sp. NPDC004330]|uniref:PRC-barrel domain-containing protein n=1 Tax=Streptomyces sp. NPDC004330 TaxID=3364700 RepID=UPI0036C46974